MWFEAGLQIFYTLRITQPANIIILTTQSDTTKGPGQRKLQKLPSYMVDRPFCMCIDYHIYCGKDVLTTVHCDKASIETMYSRKHPHNNMYSIKH